MYKIGSRTVYKYINEIKTRTVSWKNMFFSLMCVYNDYVVQKREFCTYMGIEFLEYTDEKDNLQGKKLLHMVSLLIFPYVYF